MKDKFKECLEYLGYNVFSYSGRNMYGKRCLAVSVDDGNSMAYIGANVIFTLMEEYYMELDDLALVVEYFAKARTDSLGRGEVLYFPKIEWGWEEE